jgi:hypothetical protein
MIHGFLFAYLLRVTFVVEEYEAANPLYVCLLSAQALVRNTERANARVLASLLTLENTAP